MVSIVTGTGIPAVVAVNRFPTDSDKEIDEIRKFAKDAGADSEVSEAFAKGGEGMKELAKAVVKAAEKKSTFKMYYESDATLKEKIEAVATKVYGADGVDYTPLAEEKLKQYTEWGLGKLSVCLAKTQLSVSHNPELKGRPKGFRLPVIDVRASAGAGFVFPLCGSIMTMPGLSATPAGELMDIDENGGIIGLTGK
jgi:formyltetrahydrofolate synthetase